MKNSVSSCRSTVCGLALWAVLSLGACVQASSVFDMTREDNPYRAGFNHPLNLTVKILTESSFLDVNIQYNTPSTISRNLTVMDRELLMRPAYMICENKYWESVIGFIDEKAKEAEKAAAIPTIASVLEVKPSSGPIPFISKTGLTYSFYGFQDYCVNDQIMSIQISNVPFLSIADFDTHYIQQMSALRLNVFATPLELEVYLSNAFRGHLLKNANSEVIEALDRMYA